MRIGLFIEDFRPTAGGAEQWTYQFVRAIATRNHEVHVVARSFAPHDVPIIEHVLDRAASRLGSAAAAADTLCSLRLDVVHDTGAGWYCDVFQPHCGSRRAANEQNLLIVPKWLRPIRRALAPWLPRYRRFETLVRRQYADDGRCFVAISRRVADDFVRLHNVPRDRIRLIYNGVDVDRFSPSAIALHREPTRRRLGLDDDATLLLIVAHNFKLKGVPALLEATAQLAAKGRTLHLAVVGGKRLGPWVRRAQGLGIGSRVTFTGSIADPTPYYAAADVYVQPTFYDPCSLVVLEALACGLPAVTSRFNGVSELITPGQEGFVLDDPANPVELAERLDPLCDPAARKPMAEAARRLALEHTFRHNVDELLAVYEEVFARKAAGRS